MDNEPSVPLTSEMRATVERQRLGFVATVTESGEPNVSPKGTFVVVDERTLAFGDVRSPGTTSNIGNNANVEVNFVDPLGRKGFRARGKATIHPKGSAVYREYHRLFARWGALAERIKNIVLIDVQFAKPLTSPVYDDGASEADLRAHWAALMASD